MLGCKVRHVRFGPGTIIQAEEQYLHIRFDGEENTRVFPYPDAFDAFLTAEDEALQLQINAALTLRQEEKQKAQAARLERLEQLQEQIRAEKAAAKVPKPSLRKVGTGKTHKS